LRELLVRFNPSASVALAGTVCLPEDAASASPAPGVVLLGGTGADTRDGDMAPERSPGFVDPPKRGLLRRIAHHLAGSGIASLRFDKRGCGESRGDASESDYDTDLIDNLAAVRTLCERPEIDAARVGVIGHSAGAFNACLVCRELPDIACAGLLGALYGSIEDLVEWNWGRVHDAWPSLTEEQRAWLIQNRPRDVVGAFNTPAFLDAARASHDSVRLEAHGAAMDLDLVRFRQDMLRPVANEFRHVRCPALVVHGGSDMNVRVEDCLGTYQALRAAGNENVDLVIIPGLDHSFQPVEQDPTRWVWDRLTLATMARPVSPQALDVIAKWAARVLRPSFRTEVASRRFP
jgi:pimeloyl-ACP methyl ester carboxylesterase